MKVCNRIQGRLTEYLDDRLDGRQMQAISAHLRDCRECAREWRTLRELRNSLTNLEPVPEPADLALRIRVAVSRERARSHRSPFAAWSLAWKNSVGPFLLQASAGLASAVLLLGTMIVLVSMFTQPEPLGAATAPRLLYFSNAPGNNPMAQVSGPIVVEAYVNRQGQVYDFRIVSGPADAATRSQVESLLLFSRFEPARIFGQPVRGLAVLSFSGVNVRG